MDTLSDFPPMQVRRFTSLPNICFQTFQNICCSLLRRLSYKDDERELLDDFLLKCNFIFIGLFGLFLSSKSKPNFGLPAATQVVYVVIDWDLRSTHLIIPPMFSGYVKFVGGYRNRCGSQKTLNRVHINFFNHFKIIIMVCTD